jgi:hypothetical protein
MVGPAGMDGLHGCNGTDVSLKFKPFTNYV